MFVIATQNQVEALLGEPELIADDRIVPEQCPEISHSPYRPEYGWLFWYERRLAGFLEPWLDKFRHQLIGESGILCEALSNAFYHGHRKDAYTPIRVQVFRGRCGLLVRIKDRGAGFDVAAVYDKFRTGSNYYTLAGNGIRLMGRSRIFFIYYTGGGTTFNLLYPFDPRTIDALERIGPGKERSNAPQTPLPPKSLPKVPAQTVDCTRIIPKPADKMWVQAAFLFDRAENRATAFGANAADIPAIGAYIRGSLKDIDCLTGRLAVGCPDTVSIATSTTHWIISRAMSATHILVTVLHEGVTPALARYSLREIYAYLKKQA